MTTWKIKVDTTFRDMMEPAENLTGNCVRSTTKSLDGRGGSLLLTNTAAVRGIAQIALEPHSGKVFIEAEVYSNDDGAIDTDMFIIRHKLLAYKQSGSAGSRLTVGWGFAFNGQMQIQKDIASPPTYTAYTPSTIGNGYLAYNTWHTFGLLVNNGRLVHGIVPRWMSNDQDRKVVDLSQFAPLADTVAHGTAPKGACNVIELEGIGSAANALLYVGRLRVLYGHD